MPPAPPEDLDPDRLTPSLLLWAYAQGIFPMAHPSTGRIEWYSPDPRALIPLDDRFHVPKNLARVLRKGIFEIRLDTDFRAVMRACAAPRRDQDEEETWISDELIDVYATLADLGHTRTVEAWRDGVMVGGLYGVQLGGAFFGESMFIRPEAGGTDASKACLVHLVRILRRGGFTLLDTQFWTPHLARFGCFEVSRREYLRRLADAIERNGRWPASGTYEADYDPPSSDAARSRPERTEDTREWK